MIKLNKW